MNVPSRSCWSLAVVLAIAGCSSGTGNGGPDAGATCSLRDSDLPSSPGVADYALAGAVTKADDDQELYDLIDGAGDRFTSAGFLCLRSGRYSSPSGADITVSIYDQATQVGATTVLDAYSTSQTPLTPTRGDASNENTTLPLNYQADLRVGRLFIDVVADSPESREQALAVLDAVLAKLGK